MKSKKNIGILSFGEVLFDIINSKEHIGGAPLNFAANLANLGFDVAMLSSVGTDELGAKALDIIAKLKINKAYIHRDKVYPTGVVQVKLTESGQPSYDICKNAAYDYISYSDDEIAKILSLKWDAFYFGSLAQRNIISKQTLKKFLTLFEGEVFFDVNLRQNYYSKEMLEESLNFASIIKLNDDELKTISALLYNEIKSKKEFCQLICKTYDVKAIIITLGEKGCEFYNGNQLLSAPAIKVKVVDTVGAGDAFSAGFLFKYLNGCDPYEAILFANDIAAKIVGQQGAIPINDIYLGERNR